MDGSTPRTPEILNSLMAMTNPLEYSYPVNNAQTCSQLIKEGVKLLIQSKRKHSGGDSSDGNESSTSKAKIARRRETSMTDHRETSEDDIDSKASPRSTVALTPEDEDRRRRRRERNKIAATKCRMKKRERTVNLINESETLDAQNKELKTQVSKLETECRKLLEVLQAHGPTCVHQKGYQPLPSLSTIAGSSISSNGSSSSGGNVKYMNDLNYSDQNQTSQAEIKYSECLKSVASTPGSSMDNFSNQDSSTLLPPGYCKLSPSEPTTYMLESELAVDQPIKSDYIPGNTLSSTQSTPSSHQPTKNGRAKPGPKPRQTRTSNKTNITSAPSSATPKLPSIGNTKNNTFSGKGNLLLAATLMTSTPTSSPSSVSSPLTVASSVSNVNVINPIANLGTTDDDDFILKSELIDTHSPYTTVQSADRFLFDANLDLYNNNAHSPLTASLNCGPSHQQQQHHQQSQSNNQLQQQHNASLNNNNNNNPNMINENDKLNHLNAIKDNTSNTLLEFSANFETLKPATIDYTQQQQQSQSQHSNGMHQHQQEQQHQLGSLLVGDPSLGQVLHHHPQQQSHQHQHQHRQQSQQHEQHHLQQHQQHHQLQQQIQQHHLQQQQQQQLVNNTLDLLGPVTNDFLLLTDDDPTGFTDLDSGITAYNSINGCLA
uniref:BZIP domain-containing protein n=1 Tax=Anopheles farauti TaxID=69004 RepID=A0A182QZV9_9DIPT